MIVIDCFSLILKEGGTKAYLRSLLHAISLRHKTPITLLVPDLPEVNDADIPTTPSFTIHKKQLNPFLLSLIKAITGSAYYRYIAYIWEAYYLPKEIHILNPDIIFHPYQIVTDYQTHAKKLVVVHDIFHWKYQDRYSYIEKKIYNTFLKGCETADSIITISDTSKNEIIHNTQIPKEKVIVCYEGFNAEYLHINSPEEVKAVLHKYNLPSLYVLSFNSPRTHKNTIASVNVFAKLKKRAPDLRLILIGGTIHTNPQVYMYLKDNNLLDSVDCIPLVETIHHFKVIYQYSLVFIFLSTEEGFGLPPLEALASGTLPIISQLSSMKELFVPFIPSFNPDNTDEIADYINTVIAHPEIKTAAIHKAEVLLQKYSWQAILPLYANILSLE